MKKVSRRKLFVLLQDTDEWTNSGQDYGGFQANLRGPIGCQALFMPTSGLSPYENTKGTPPTSTLPIQSPTTQPSDTSGGQKKPKWST